MMQCTDGDVLEESGLFPVKQISRRLEGISMVFENGCIHMYTEGCLGFHQVASHHWLDAELYAGTGRFAIVSSPL